MGSAPWSNWYPPGTVTLRHVPGESGAMEGSVWGQTGVITDVSKTKVLVFGALKNEQAWPPSTRTRSRVPRLKPTQAARSEPTPQQQTKIFSVRSTQYNCHFHIR